MDITPETRTITTYTLKLTDTDAAELLADPYGFSERLRESLLPHMPAAAPKWKPGAASQLTISKNGNGRKGAKKAKAPKAPKGAKLPVATCPECGKTLAAKFLPRHMAAKHDTASAATSSSTE